MMKTYPLWEALRPLREPEAQRRAGLLAQFTDKKDGPMTMGGFALLSQPVREGADL